MLKVIRVEILRGWQTQLNYPFSFILNIIQNLFVMGIAIWMISSLTSMEEVLGVLFWPVALTALASSAQSIQEDMQLGTFERVASSRFNLLGILISRTIAGYILASLLTIIALILGYIFIDMHLPIHVIISFLLLIFLTGTGLSLILTGLQIYYRDTGPLGNMIIFGSMIALVIPWDGWLSYFETFAFIIIPFAAGAIYIHSPEPVLLILGAVNAGIYFVLGVTLFPILYRRARLVKGLGRY